MSRLAAACFALAAASTPAAAQGLPDWSGAATIYGWFPVIEGNQTGPDGRPIVNLDAKDILEALDFAFFATGEARRDRWGLMGDFAYVDLSSDASARPPFTARAEVGTTVWFATLAGTWRLTGDGTNTTFVDVYGGVRYYDASLDFDVRLLGDSVRRSIDGDANWVDPILGVKGRYVLGERWSAYGFLDAGGFGIDGASDLSWQAYTGVNYLFSEKFAGNLGYRYMSIDYDDDIRIDVDIHGPVLGLTYRF
jgi:opacity protein-like surface antigen